MASGKFTTFGAATAAAKPLLQASKLQGLLLGHSDRCMSPGGDAATGIDDLTPSQYRGEGGIIYNALVQEPDSSQEVALLKLQKSPSLHMPFV